MKLYLKLQILEVKFLTSNEVCPKSWTFLKTEMIMEV